MAQIYITYRWIDTVDVAGRIYDRLAQEFGGDNVFRDIESISPSEDYSERMLQEIARCKILIPVIGVRWFHPADDQGNRKIDDPTDWVHRELATFLGRSDTKIIPVLVHRAHLPLAWELPPQLADLSRKSAVELRSGREFQQDMLGVINAIYDHVQITAAPVGSKIVIIHSPSDPNCEPVTGFLNRQALESVTLEQRPNTGQLIIEKFTQDAVGFAIVLMTPAATASAGVKHTMLFELGYFAHQLGRRKVCVLYHGELDLPADLYGVLYIEMDESGSWQLQLAKEMNAAGLNIDFNQVF